LLALAKEMFLRDLGFTGNDVSRIATAAFFDLKVSRVEYLSAFGVQ